MSHCRRAASLPHLADSRNLASTSTMIPPFMMFMKHTIQGSESDIAHSNSKSSFLKLSLVKLSSTVTYLLAWQTFFFLSQPNTACVFSREQIVVVPPSWCTATWACVTATEQQLGLRGKEDWGSRESFLVQLLNICSLCYPLKEP